MATEKEIKKELLSQLEAGFSETDKKKEYTPEEIILKHKSQLNRLKRIAIISWIITATAVVAIHNLKVYFLGYNFYGDLTRVEFWFRRLSDMASIVLVVSAFLITYLVYHKSKTLTLLQICARLANIENYLKKMTFDK